MAEYESVAALLTSIEADQARLRDTLSGKDEATRSARPPSGKWSAVENVRHLVFAEYVQLARYVRAGQSWRAFEPLPPHGLEIHAPLKMVGDETNSLRALLETWVAVHDSTRILLDRDNDEIRKALTRHRTHLRTHMKTVESLLKVRKK